MANGPCGGGETAREGATGAPPSQPADRSHAAAAVAGHVVGRVVGSFFLLAPLLVGVVSVPQVNGRGGGCNEGASVHPERFVRRSMLKRQGRERPLLDLLDVQYILCFR